LPPSGTAAEKRTAWVGGAAACSSASPNGSPSIHGGGSGVHSGGSAVHSGGSGVHSGSSGVHVGSPVRHGGSSGVHSGGAGLHGYFDECSPSRAVVDRLEDLDEVPTLFIHININTDVYMYM